MRRSVSSVPTIIAEGYGHQSNAQLSEFLHIAPGSISELHYLSEPLFNKLEIETIEIRKMIFAYLNKL